VFRDEVVEEVLARGVDVGATVAVRQGQTVADDGPGVRLEAEATAGAFAVVVE
jgi:hypothetical protein